LHLTEIYNPSPLLETSSDDLDVALLPNYEFDTNVYATYEQGLVNTLYFLQFEHPSNLDVRQS
jgi:hypothetical protein